MKSNKTRKTMVKRGTKRTKRTKNAPYIFTEKEYNSNDGMLTAVWGPSMWHYLHTMSFNYPIHPNYCTKRRYRDFVISLRNVLPCGKCRENLKCNFAKLPLKMRHMESRDTFSRYIYQLHELINEMLHKRSNLTFEDVRERYEHFRSRCNKTKRQLAKELKERGCTDSLYGEKAKCVIQIVPQTKKCETLQIRTGGKKIF